MIAVALLLAVESVSWRTRCGYRLDNIYSVCLCACEGQTRSPESGFWHPNQPPGMDVGTGWVPAGCGYGCRYP